MTKTREDANRDRWHELDASEAGIREVSDPLRKKRDQHVAKAAERERELNEEIKTIEAPLFDIVQEKAELTRALKGKTGRPDSAAE